ncbi:MAG TPA: hypothetical protein PKM64_06365, partial [Thermoanaerobaculia bacterium]|nr:hypothetical protein [Thermoanaerobaculia bacterium]
EVALVPEASTWRYFKGMAEPSAAQGAWRQLSFDDSAWLSGQAAIGFGESAPPGGLVADRWIAAVPLAGPAARWLSLHPPVWEPSLLLQPLYLRAPTPEVRLGAAPDDRPA